MKKALPVAWASLPKMKTTHCALAVFLLAVTAFSGCATQQTPPPPPESTPLTGLEGIVTPHPLAPAFPEAAKADRAQLLASPQGKQILEWAQGYASMTTLPETTYTRYRAFKETGDRSPYEAPYFQKRDILVSEVLKLWLTGDVSRLSRINDLIWSICEETTWVTPAHEGPGRQIDLFAAETGASLAHMLALIGDQLPKEIVERVQKEVKTRILDDYLAHGEGYWWGFGRNNWTGVCAGSVGETFLLLEEDPARLCQGIALVLKQLQRFIDVGFEPDGTCLEGIGYWNYGLSHYVIFAEMLWVRSAGKIDLLAQEKMKAIARYPLNVALAPGIFASFSDSHEGGYVKPYIAAKLAERTGVTGLRGLTRSITDNRVDYILCHLLWWDGTIDPFPALDDVILPESGLARLTGELGGKPLTLAAKAGHNAEPHNNNDVGSFIVCVDGVVYLCDPGAGLYNRDYFSKKRYENVFANSYGHSVPRIAGQLQKEGKEFCGTLEKTGEKAIQITFNKAYPVSQLRSATRQIRLEQNVLALEDAFKSKAPGLDVEEAFVTWQAVEVNGNVARILSDKGVLAIRAEEGVFRAERLEEACKANHKKDMLTRITVAYPASPERAARFVMTYRPR
ncbi:MAG TPA: heparinase II/III family protein [Candidatus Hydrogenedentes bacterium]|nr:heparinase II/III family protein [Candidatus Hydrogenedentota bacterium]